MKPLSAENSQGLHLKRRMLLIKRWDVILLFCVIPGGAFLYFVPPGEGSVYPPCFFHTMTGFYCPGCGITRAVYHLLHGEFIRALSYNPLVVPLFLLALSAIIARLYSLFTGKRLNFPDISTRFAWLLVFLVLFYWIARNLPFFPFTLLAPPH